MKIAATIARILLGIVFFVFGLNKLYTFIPAQMPGGIAGQFMGALVSSHYLLVVGFFEAACGLMLLLNRYVPLALAILGPIIVNILIIGILLTHAALPSGLLVAICWLILFWRLRPAFAGLFQARTPA